MGNPTLLLLSTYPIVKPRHGGQLRAAALAQSYRAAGFEVRSVAVVEEGLWPPAALGPHDIEFPADDPKWFLGGESVPLSSDLRSGLFASSSERHYQQIRRSLPSKVSVIHLEQPFLLPLAQRIMSEPKHSKAILIYGSANIEAPLRETIFRQMAIDNGGQVVERIRALEQEACRAAQLVLAVAPFDHDELVKFGARRVLRANNGVEAWPAPPKAIAKWRARLEPTRRFALFAASAHPPNFDGFFRAFGDSLGFVPPDCKIVVAGSVGPHILDFYRRARFDTLNVSRLEIIGEIGPPDLPALKTLATAFLLPIFEGGGSNLKTAEALYSGKPVVATSMSLRAFERFAHLPELVVANTRDEFRLAVRELLSPAKRVGEGSKSDQALRDQLLWRNCLAPVGPAIHELLSAR